MGGHQGARVVKNVEYDRVIPIEIVIVCSFGRRRGSRPKVKWEGEQMSFGER